MPDYQWYEVVEGTDLQQGDILLNVDIPVVSDASGSDVSGTWDTYDLIVMTQSCDIPKPTIRHLIMCPVWELDVVAEQNEFFGTPRGWENLRQGRVMAYHLLNRCEIPRFEHDYTLVQFERVIERPKDLVYEAAVAQGERLRLLPPYREHLAQAFARFFMRVGLPIDLPATRE